MKYLCAALFLSAMLGCSDRQPKPVDSTVSPESPIQAIEAIIRLYGTSDFDSLIRTRYAEIGKAEDESQVQKLIDRFTTNFQNADTKAQAIETYESALKIEPELSEDGATATYKMGDRFIKLSRMPNGLWGFHL